MGTSTATLTVEITSDGNTTINISKATPTGNKAFEVCAIMAKLYLDAIGVSTEDVSVKVERTNASTPTKP